ncbi:hypothetical protein MLD38_004249 [Melastoma candidum]|uniref:Uncharacterized protein n=1 Tax=Melastoma candidum TaxID=119954 RepID=A0ACB9S4U3_9MYRT|nr:hypothetical protein MLD38_004249 [Melastoma candidum]
MAESKKHLEFDELDKLLGEIPSATSGNLRSEDSGPKRGSLARKLSPVLVDTCRGPCPEKFPTNGSLIEGRAYANESKQSRVNGTQMADARLPDDLSLASALAGLSLENGYAAPVANSAFLLGNGYPNNFGIENFTIESHVNNIYPFQSSSGAPAPYHEFSGPNLIKVDDQMSNRVQLLPGMQIPAVEFPVNIMTTQKQYLVDSKALLPYFHHRRDGYDPHISWSTEDDHIYKRWNGNFCYKQLCDYQVDPQHVPFQGNINYVPRAMGQNPRGQYHEAPISHQCREYEQGQFLDRNGTAKFLRQPNLGLSSSDAHASFSPRIRNSRLYEVSGEGGLKHAWVGGNNFIGHARENGKLSSNGQLCRGLCNQTAGFFQPDDIDSWFVPPDETYLKNYENRFCSQKINLDVEEVAGRICLMAKDQQGCRLLQRKIAEGPPEVVEKIFFEVIDHMIELMTDPFGNYLVQKLLEVCDEGQLTQILKVVTRMPGDLVQISCDMHGTRAVQKVIEMLKIREHKVMVVNSLKPGIVTLMKNMNGNHVAQRCLQYLGPAYTQFLFEAAATNCVELATDRHGCCVLQKCLSHSGGKERQLLIHEIVSNALILSQDPFGNYVVQYVFELHVPEVMMEILDHLEGKFVDLSMQKYSSNVVEKCLKFSGDERRARIIRELIDHPRFDQIMQDPYGNYVIQAALSVSEGTIKDSLVEAIEPHVPGLRTSPYGKKVLSSSRMKKQPSWM